jgi:GT2 family glycosyltransferase
MSEPRTVLAIVLSYQAPAGSLERCVEAIASQGRRPNEILIVDNASSLPVESRISGVENSSNAPVSVLRLPENLGPAGGYAAGLRHFLATDKDFAWLLDDDCAPHQESLARLLAEADRSTAPVGVMSTMLDRASGAVINTQGWCAVLIPRTIVQAVGVPNEHLFWWTEDTEYLQWRIPRAGFRIFRCEQALVDVDRSREPGAKPAWKFYYETRNQVYHRLHVQRAAAGEPVPRHLTPRVRGWRAARTIVKMASRAVFREREGRWRKLTMVVRGAADGVRGRLGKTVGVDVPDRPGEPQPGVTL